MFWFGVRKVGMLGREHAEERMVDIPTERCARERYSKNANVSVEGSKMGMDVRQHAEGGMMDDRGKLCA